MVMDCSAVVELHRTSAALSHADLIHRVVELSETCSDQLDIIHRQDDEMQTLRARLYACAEGAGAKVSDRYLPDCTECCDLMADQVLSQQPGRSSESQTSGAHDHEQGSSTATTDHLYHDSLSSTTASIPRAGASPQTSPGTEQEDISDQIPSINSSTIPSSAKEFCSCDIWPDREPVQDHDCAMRMEIAPSFCAGPTTTANLMQYVPVTKLLPTMSSPAQLEPGAVAMCVLHASCSTPDLDGGFPAGSASLTEACTSYWQQEASTLLAGSAGDADIWGSGDVSDTVNIPAVLPSLQVSDVVIHGTYKWKRLTRQ